MVLVEWDGGGRFQSGAAPAGEVLTNRERFGFWRFWEPRESINTFDLLLVKNNRKQRTYCIAE